jgi:LDH2 family malate/lactate/ureidoglycolate dehydrogenase
VVAPAGGEPAFFFDVATSTVAIGKLRLAQLHGRPLEPGWALDASGETTTDPATGLASRRLTPLGATPALGSHKGYGLAASVEVLATMLTGAAYCSLRDRAAPHFNVGHFFIAIDPAAFRAAGDFEEELAAMQQTLRSTAPAEAGRPVLAPGDPEAAALAERTRAGVPVPESLIRQLREIAAGAGAPWVMQGQ